MGVTCTQDILTDPAEDEEAVRSFSTPRQYQPTPSLLLLQVLVGHPLDTIKVRIQTMESLPGQPPPYKGMGDCAQQIIKKEGVSFEHHQRLNTSIDRSACTHAYKVRTCTGHAFSHLAPCFRSFHTPHIYTGKRSLQRNGSTISRSGTHVCIVFLGLRRKYRSFILFVKLCNYICHNPIIYMFPHPITPPTIFQCARQINKTKRTSKLCKYRWARIFSATRMPSTS